MAKERMSLCWEVRGVDCLSLLACRGVQVAWVGIVGRVAVAMALSRGVSSPVAVVARRHVQDGVALEHAEMYVLSEFTICCKMSLSLALAFPGRCVGSMRVRRGARCSACRRYLPVSEMGTPFKHVRGKSFSYQECGGRRGSFIAALAPRAQE